MIIIVMGVAGTGKSTIGKLLAQRLNCVFIDADDYHPAANIEKMRAGIPLTDEDRLPWLHTLASTLAQKAQAQECVVLACSALKESYRHILTPTTTKPYWIFLKGEPELIQERLSTRKGHFMAPDLLASQLATLEEPTNAFIVNIADSPAEIVEEILERIT